MEYGSGFEPSTFYMHVWIFNTIFSKYFVCFPNSQGNPWDERVTLSVAPMEYLEPYVEV